jgi:hypothetical protein
MSKLPFEEPHKEEAGQTTPTLSPTIRLALTTALRRIELAAWRAEERLRLQGTPLLALTRMVDPFTPEQRAKLLALLGELRSEVARLARSYRLPASEENLRAVMLAEFGLLWCDLEELHPARLRDYGELSATAARRLWPEIKHVIDLVVTLNEWAAMNQPPPPPGQGQP